MMRRTALFAFTVMFAMTLGLISCKPSTPHDIIQPDDMEDLLYDYHLADAMAQQAKGDYGQNVISYRAAVLKKYGVSQAEFDSSMVYYMRHTTQLHDIYEDIAERMQDEAQSLGSTVGMGAGQGNYQSASGDTIDIWKGPQSLILVPNEPYNLLSFHYKPDTKAQKGDVYVLTAQSNFIFQDGMRDGIMVLTLEFNNDSTASRVVHLSTSSQMQVSLEDLDSVGIKEIRGYFMLNKNNQANSSSTTLQLMSLNNIHLLRCKIKRSPTIQQATGSRPNTDSMRRRAAQPNPQLQQAPAGNLEKQGNTAPAVAPSPGLKLPAQ